MTIILNGNHGLKKKRNVSPYFYSPQKKIATRAIGCLLNTCRFCSPFIPNWTEQHRRSQSSLIFCFAQKIAFFPRSFSLTPSTPSLTPTTSLSRCLSPFSPFPTVPHCRVAVLPQSARSCCTGLGLSLSLPLLGVCLGRPHKQPAHRLSSLGTRGNL